MMETIKRKRPDSIWDDPDLDKELLNFYMSNFTSSEIAHLMGRGLTRNAIIGRLARMGSARPERSKRPVRPARDLRPAKQLSAAALPHNAALYPGVDSMPVTIYDLDSNHCRWPLWPHDSCSGDRFYCGSAVAVASAYCPGHRAISVVMSKEVDHA